MSDDKPDQKPRGAVILAVLVFVLVLLVGAIGFTVSWDNLLKIAGSALPGDFEAGTVKVAWAHAIPAVIDGGILALTIMRLWNAINGRRLPIASWFLNGLILTTIAVNATAGDNYLSMLLHALPAAVYVAVSETFIHSILKRYKLTADDKPKPKKRGVTLSRWILAPISTFVMWRVMTISGSNDMTIFVQLARMRVSQHQDWRKRHGSAWWFPVSGVSRADRTDLRMRLLELSVGTTVPETAEPGTTEPQNVPAVLETTEPEPRFSESWFPEPQNQNRETVSPVLETVTPEPQNQNQHTRKPRTRNRVVDGTAIETGTVEPVRADGMTEAEKDAQIMQALNDWYADDDRPSIGNQTAIAKHFGVGKLRVSTLNKRREARIESSKASATL